jgi:hypothetical protein
MASPDGPPPPVSNPITGTWRNSFADKDQKGRALQKFDRVEELVCDHVHKDIHIQITNNNRCIYRCPKKNDESIAPLFIGVF